MGSALIQLRHLNHLKFAAEGIGLGAGMYFLGQPNKEDRFGF